MRSIVVTILLLAVTNDFAVGQPPHDIPPTTIPELPGSQSGPRGEPVVRMIYLVPHDGSIRPCITVGVERAIRHLQRWYFDQMANGKTFRLHDAMVVEVFQTPHDAAWYSEHQNGTDGLWFWNNVLHDGFALTGGRFNDPLNRWVYYIDATAGAGQQQVGGTNGVAMLHRTALNGLIGGRNSLDTCGWVGLLAHELGHAFGLHHPVGCDDNDPTTPCPDDVLMGTGWDRYPSLGLLTAADRAILEQSPFFVALDPGPLGFGCRPLLPDTDNDDVPDCRDECMDSPPALWIAASGCADCNTNGTPDDVDISTGASRDCNLDGVPDECSLLRGAVGAYYSNVNLTVRSVVRLDPRIDFDWRDPYPNSPDPSIGEDTFSVRWRTQVIPPVSGSYTFYTRTDDGVRLWIHGQLLIDHWMNQSATWWSGSCDLVANQPTELRMEYFERTGDALARLQWSGPATPRSTIPTERLLPFGLTPLAGDVDADGAVDLVDLTTLLAHFGTSDGASPRDGDLDFDADVDLSDLTILLANFGTSCP